MSERSPSRYPSGSALQEEDEAPGHDKLVADIKKVVEEVTQPMEQRLKEFFTKGFNELSEQIKRLAGSQPTPPSLS